MANITLKNIPDDLYRDLKEYAAMNHRSLNNEIIVCIEKTIRSRRIDRAKVLDRIAALRRDLNLPYLTGDKLREIETEGRR